MFKENRQGFEVLCCPVHGATQHDPRIPTILNHIGWQANAYNGIEMAHIPQIPSDRGISRRLLIEIEGD
jgi:hypothetical protein